MGNRPFCLGHPLAGASIGALSDAHHAPLRLPRLRLPALALLGPLPRPTRERSPAAIVEAPARVWRAIAEALRTAGGRARVNVKLRTIPARAMPTGSTRSPRRQFRRIALDPIGRYDIYYPRNAQELLWL